jgi:hypothetical protein
MQKYIVEEPKLVVAINKKIQELMMKSADRFAELNPQMVFDIELDPMERQVMEQIQAGQLSKDEIQGDLKAKIDAVIAKLEEVDLAEKEGKLNLEIFSIEDVRQALAFTDEEILQFLYSSKVETDAIQS